MSYTRWNAFRATDGFSVARSRYSQKFPSQCCSRNRLVSSRLSMMLINDTEPLLLPVPLLLELLIAMLVYSARRLEWLSSRLALDASAPALAHEPCRSFTDMS